MKVLLIDDDADLLEMTVKRFKRKGYEAEFGDDTADPRIEKNKQNNKNFTCFQKPYSIDDVIKFIEQ